MNEVKPQTLADEGFVRLWDQCEHGKYPLFENIKLEKYPGIKVFLHDTGAGRIPVVSTEQRKDFEGIFRDIFYKGEQRVIPPAIGAVMVKGLQDFLGRGHRIILISNGYYSNISPEDMGLCAEDWKEKSRIIRLYHESAHYYTLRKFGFAGNSIWDEFLADAMGIIAAFGCYKASFFLRFLGLEQYPEYRSGGRLENYLPKGSGRDALPDMAGEAYRLAEDLEEQLREREGPLDLKEILEKLCGRQNLSQP